MDEDRSSKTGEPETTADVHLRNLDGLQEEQPLDRLDGLFRSLGGVQYELAWLLFTVGQAGAAFELARTKPERAASLLHQLTDDFDNNVRDLYVAFEVFVEYVDGLRQDAVENVRALLEGDSETPAPDHLVAVPNEAAAGPLTEAELFPDDRDFPHLVLDQDGVVDRFSTEEEARDYIREADDPNLRYMEVIPDY